MRFHIEYEHDIPINIFIWTPDSNKQPLHYHSSLEIGCCISGVGQFYFGSKKYSVSQGDLFIVNHTERHIACADEGNPSTFLFLNFSPSLLMNEDERLLLPFSIHSERFQNLIPENSTTAKTILPLMEGIWRELQSKQEGYQIMAKGLLMQICCHLLRYYSSEVTTENWRKITDSFSQFRAISTYMEEHFYEPLELSHLAQALQLSTSRVSRLFQEVLGQGFKEYLTLLRLTEARRLLVRTNMSITDICFTSGFQSVSSFYRVFVQSESMSPLEYRSKYSGTETFEYSDL